VTFAPIDTAGLKPATLRDQPQPMLIWAPLADLVIDRRYQRDITPAGRAAIQRIANDWDWSKYQPILVAPTDAGKLAVVDGQHRAHAAALVGLTSVPAMTVAMTPQQQAAGFAAVNRDRVSMSPHQIYRAELAAGTPWAVQARDAVEAAGCHLATGRPSHAARRAGRIYQIGQIKRMIEAGEAAAVTAGLAAIRTSAQGEDVESYESVFVRPWLDAVKRDQRFLRLPLAAIFDEIDIEHIAEIARIKAKHEDCSALALTVAAIADHLRAALDRKDTA